MTAEVGHVGVAGDEAAAVASTLEDTGLDTLVARPTDVLDAAVDAVVAVGESTLLGLARERPTCPILPVDAGTGVRSVPHDQLSDAATRLRAGNWTTESHPLIAVDDGTREHAVFMDAMLAAAEPAHISEFTVRTGTERVAQFRADGVVAATPAGTGGYAHAAGAPVIPPGPSVLALVPIAPFATTLDHWVVPADTVTITVEREDATVEVLADDRMVGHATVDTPVELAADGTVALIRVAEGQSPFGRRGAELEKL
jgi:NAD+ kinase